MASKSEPSEVMTKTKRATRARGDVGVVDSENGSTRRDVCLFCLKPFITGDLTVLENVAPGGENLKLVLNDPSKNKQSFELLCKILHVKVGGEEQFDFDVTNPLPLCLKCQHLYQEIFQIHFQITALAKLLHERAEMIKVIVKTSDTQKIRNSTSDQFNITGLRDLRKAIFRSAKGGKGSGTRQFQQRTIVSPSNKSVNIEENVLIKTETELDYQQPVDSEIPRAWSSLHNDDSDGERDEGLDYPEDIGADIVNDSDYTLSYTESERSNTDDGNDVGSSSWKKTKPKKRGRKPKKERLTDCDNARKDQLDVKEIRSRKTSYKCHICDEIFIGKSPFNQHYNDVHPEEIRYTCKFCKLHFKGLWNCTVHQRKHTGERPYKCDYCAKGFTTRKAKTAHIKVIHHGEVEKMFSCEKCSKSFASRSALKIHEEVHRKAIIICKLCGTSFKLYLSFCKHNRLKHNGKAECTEPLLNPEKEHLESLGLNMDEVKTRLVCHLCGAKIVGRVNFEDHFITMHPGMNPKQCKCGKKFSTYLDCRRHAARHLDQSEKPIKCDKCAKRFVTKTELNSHSRVHIPNRSNSFVCDLCGQAFASQGTLYMHRKKHDSSRWVCEFCGKSYAERKGYIVHKKSAHLNIRPHKCPHCTKSYTEHAELRKHIRTHTKEKPYKCPICDKHFPYTSSRSRHVLEVHGKQTNRGLGVKRSKPVLSINAVSVTSTDNAPQEATAAEIKEEQNAGTAGLL